LIDIILILLFLVVGYFVGILVGMFGIGGGLVYVPVLLFILPILGFNDDLTPFVAIATSFLAGSIASTSAAIRHYIKQNIDLRKSLYLASGSVITAFLTPYIVIQVEPQTLKWILGTVLILVSIKMLFENGKSDSKSFQLPHIILPFFGLLVGIVSAFSGVGGGIMFVPILIYFYGLDIKRAVGTSTLSVVVTMVSSMISFSLKTPSIEEPNYFLMGYIFVFAGLFLGIGSITGAIHGVKIVLGSSGKTVKRLFALILIIAVIKIIF
jgi:uncharacterized protein